MPLHPKQTILSWIQECIEKHSTCNNRSKTYSYPKRLLDVGTVPESRKVKLWESDHTIDKYIALSHCWGKSLLIRTMKESLEKWKSDIPWPLLPKTFQDAIAVT